MGDGEAYRPNKKDSERRKKIDLEKGTHKPVDIIGPYYDPEIGLRVGYGSVVKGDISFGRDITIGNGTYIISEHSVVYFGDNVSIGDLCVIKEGDDLHRNEHIHIGSGTRIKSGSKLESEISIGKNCHIGIDVILGGDVYIGNNCRLNQGANIAKNVNIGDNNTFYNCTIGQAPQGLVHEDEGTEVIIGNNNVFREYVVVHRGSLKGGGETFIGNNNHIFSQTHIAHDCIIGDHNEIVSYAALAGHVTVGNHVRISGQVGIQQFVNIGSFSFIGGVSAVRYDVLPYMVVEGNPARLRGFNKERLKRVFKGKKYDQMYHGVKDAFNFLRRDGKIKTRSEEGDDLVHKLRELKTMPAREIADFVEETFKNNRHITR